MSLSPPCVNSALLGHYPNFFPLKYSGVDASRVNDRFPEHWGGRICATLSGRIRNLSNFFPSSIFHFLFSTCLCEFFIISPCFRCFLPVHKDLPYPKKYCPFEMNSHECNHCRIHSVYSPPPQETVIIPSTVMEVVRVSCAGQSVRVKILSMSFVNEA